MIQITQMQAVWTAKLQGARADLKTAQSPFERAKAQREEFLALRALANLANAKKS